MAFPRPAHCCSSSRSGGGRRSLRKALNPATEARRPPLDVLREVEFRVCGLCVALRYCLRPLSSSENEGGKDHSFRPIAVERLCGSLTTMTMQNAEESPVRDLSRFQTMGSASLGHCFICETKRLSYKLFKGSSSSKFFLFYDFCFLKDFIYLFMRDTQRGRDTGRGRNRLRAQSRMWDSILRPWDQP